MLKKTTNILRIFAKTPWVKYVFQDIKKLSQCKSESYTYTTLNNFVKEGILCKKKIGNISVYSVNHSSKAISYLSMASEYEAWQSKQIPKADIEDLISMIPAKFFTLIVTGSYAEKKQTKKSDIDIVIISNTETKKIYSELKHRCEMNIPPIHLYVFKEKEFLQMLLDKKSNYGKEIAKNNLIFTGGEAYYRIIMEAIKNGFTG